MGSALQGVGGEVFALGAKLAAVTAGAGLAFGAVVKGAVEAGDDLGTIAERVGLSVDAYASLRHAANMADVDQEEFNAAMDKFNKNLGDMTAGTGGEFLAFLNEISPTLAKQMKAAKGTEAAFSIMTDAFAKIPDPARRATLASHAFGKSGLQMGTFMRAGSAAIQEQQSAYMRLAGSQEAFAQSAGKLDEAMKENETAFTGLRAVTMGALFPALTSLSKLLTEFMVKNRDGIQRWAEGASKAFQGWIDSGGFERLVESVKSIGNAIVKVVDTLGPMGTAFAAVGLMAAPLIASLGTLGVAVVDLGIAAIPALTAAFAAASPALAAFGAAIAPAVMLIGPFVLAAASLLMLGKAIADNWGDLAFIFKDWGTSLKFAVLDAWAAIEPILSKINAAVSIGNVFGSARKAIAGVAAVDWKGAASEAFSPHATPSAFDAAPAVASSFSGAGAVASQTSKPTEARVSVDFSNMPRGARVTTDSTSSQPVDVRAGYSMSTP